ncbi:MAG TPA: hypothetical protein VKD90_30640 [Gemmataceae bacterium]|nr:hypothetical protein [Gemmataceae bacterium]
MPAKPGETDLSTRPLNAMDRSMLEVNRTLRHSGCPEFSTQAFLWLSGRIDVARLRASITCLCQRYPILCARLDEAAPQGPAWKLRPDAECPVQEADLESGTPEAVLDHAGQLLSTPSDPATADPIRFDVLHRPDGRDVFLMQYSHALMDNGDAVPLVREIDRLFGSDVAEPDVPRTESRDLLAEHLRATPRWRRLKAALRTLDVRFRRLRRTPVMLGQDLAGAGMPVRLQVARRRIERPETRAIEQRVIQACGVPSLSMAITGSVFRALQMLTPEARGPSRNFVAGIGVDLGPPGIRRPVFQTLAAVVPVWARSEQLKDRTELMRTMNQQFRERLALDADLGMVQLSSFFQRPGSFLRERFARYSVRRLLRSGYSIWYAYFGSLDTMGEQFCGTPIEDACYVASSWPPMGVTLLVNKFQGVLVFQSTSVPGSVPESRANEFLDAVVSDLLA